MDWQQFSGLLSDSIVEKIDSRDVIAIKTRSNIWSRRELRNACEKLKFCKVPKGKLKTEYARMLVALRALRRLEGNFINKCVKQCKNDTCSICKESLEVPIFRYKEIGYHLCCIHKWISISHKFRDPIHGAEYSDADLKRIDSLVSAYGLEDSENLHALWSDNDRKEEDVQEAEHEAQLEIYGDLFERDMDALGHIFQFGNTNAIGVVSEHFESLLREASQMDEEFVQECISTFVRRVMDFGHEGFLNYLLGLSDSCSEWTNENEDDVAALGNELRQSIGLFLSENSPLEFFFTRLSSGPGLQGLPIHFRGPQGLHPSILSLMESPE